MNTVPQFGDHRRWYRERVSTYWWLWRGYYLKFVLREISSVFVAWFVVLTLLQIRALAGGPETYARFADWLKSPLLLAANLVSFLFVLYHAVTWFNLAPTALVVRIRGKRLPDYVIAGSNYAAWVVATGVLVWLILRG